MAKPQPPEGCFMHSIRHDIDMLALHEAWPGRYPFLLESADGGGEITRYDLLFRASDEYLSLDAAQGVSGTAECISVDKGFLENLNVWQSLEASDAKATALPFIGGWFLYLGYELVSEIEPKVQLPTCESALPTALAVRCPAALIHDRQNAQFWVIAETKAMLAEFCDDIKAVSASSAKYHETIHVDHLVESDALDFTQSVEKIKAYILAGDVFQVNLSRRWQGNIPQASSNAQLYKQLRSSNPAPFAGLMVWQDSAVISSSPERLVETRGNTVQTRPIAGTRPRSGFERDEDETERMNLVSHPKERAEHIMLIDLERNDLGRICKPGSVEVSELMALESYTHVHHIVSNIKGILEDDVSAGNIIRAVFPGGTITGCPKVRCMEIIAELEGEGRGYYTGAMGYLDRRGNMDLNILIRCLERSGEKISFRTGAGIVADSIPENELQETRAKALGLLRALNANGTE